MVESTISSPPWLNHQSPTLSLAYTALSCLTTAATGAGLLYYSLSDSQPIISLVRYSCLGTGVVMLVTVAVGACFTLLACQLLKWTDSKASSKSQQAQSRQSQSSSTVPCSLSLAGMLCLSMLLLSVLLELSLTCLLWWNSHQLGLQHQVRANCFCTVGEQSSSRAVGILDIDCPQLDNLSCTAVYQAVPVQMREGLVMTTRQCQRVDGRGLQSDCLHFLAFWSWFKVWRIVLPLVILMKLPLLALCCCSWLSAIGRKKVQGQQQATYHAGQYNTATSTAALDSQLFTHSSLPVDPVKFYGNMCAAVDDRHAQEKPIVQEHVQVEEMTSLASKPATLRSTAAMARFISNVHAPAPCSPPPPLTAVACPVPPVGTNEEISVGLTRDDSPPDIQDHIISTPIKSDKSIKTPQFDLSKVIKPLTHRLNSANKSASWNTPRQVATQNKVPYSNSDLKENKKKVPTHFDFELQNFPQYSHQDHIQSPGLTIPPPPPMRKSSGSGWARSPVPPSLLPPPKPTRSSSISSPTFPFQPTKSSEAQPPPPSIQQIRSPINTPVQVVVDDASECDYDSSTCEYAVSFLPRWRVMNCVYAGAGPSPQARCSLW